MPGTVTVACALPHGFQMQLQEKVATPSPTREDPTRKEEISRYVGPVVIIDGPARNRDTRRVEAGDVIPTAGGYALTFGVDKDLWDKWRVQMKDWEPLVKGQVFAHEREDTAKGEARSGKHGPSGFEPYNPSQPPAEFAGKIKTAEKQGG